MFLKQAVWINVCTEMIWQTGTRKIIEYDFCPHREYLVVVCFSQSKIISVNWLLCYRWNSSYCCIMFIMWCQTQNTDEIPIESLYKGTYSFFNFLCIFKTLSGNSINLSLLKLLKSKEWLKNTRLYRAAGASSQCYWDELMLFKCQINTITNNNRFLLPTKCLEGVLK